MRDNDQTDHCECPKCGSDNCYRDAVDVGIGIMYGPYGCSDCGWSESNPSDYPELDPAKLDPRGGYTP
jgi:hypothetical protein